MTSTVSSVNITGDIINEVNSETNYTIPEYPARPETYIIPVLFAIITFIGTLGNGSLIYFFCKYPQMRKVPNIYILSLSIGDLFVVLLAVPFQSIIYTYQSYPFGEVVCKIQNSISTLSIGVTVLTLTALSADRYFAIVYPVNTRAGSKTRTVCCVAIIWIIAFLCALPDLIISHIQTVPGGSIAFCNPFTDSISNYKKIRTTFKCVIFFIVPLIVISVFYLLMAKHLIRAAGGLPGEAHCQINRRQQAEDRRKVAKMVLFIVGVFFLCFLPINIYDMWFFYDPNSQENYNWFWHIFRMTGFCLSYINSCINPIALYCISKTFRKYYNRHLFCCEREEPERTETLLRHISSCKNVNTVTMKTEQYDMSTFHGPDRTHV